MDPKKIYELILSGREDFSSDMDCGFDVSEIIAEFAAVDKALRELETAIGEFEDNNEFDRDLAAIDSKLNAQKMALEFEGVDAAYEL